MDSDDIMVPERVHKQMLFMFKNPHINICGSQIKCFKNNINNIITTTQHPPLTWEQYIDKPSHWFSNHPTLCYRKSAVLAAGNYDINKSRMTEDFDLTLRMLKMHGYIHNLNESLLYYRLHDNQVTHQGGIEGPTHWHKIRTELIQKLINS